MGRRQARVCTNCCVETVLAQLAEQWFRNFLSSEQDRGPENIAITRWTGSRHLARHLQTIVHALRSGMRAR